MNEQPGWQAKQRGCVVGCAIVGLLLLIALVALRDATLFG